MPIEGVHEMVFFNWATMQMAAKIVYYGPGLCGKTSNLSYIYAKTAPNSRGEMVSLETESDRTLFFDLLPIEVGTIGGFKTRLQLYTVPGQVFYNTTRKLVLKGVDGLVFVADSQRPMREANIESFESLIDNLNELGLEVDDLPLVMQYNKRDLKNILTVEELNTDLNAERSYAFYEAEAINGAGVFETLKEITKLTLKKLRKRMVAPHAAAPGGPRAAPPPAQVEAPSPRRPAVSAAALARAAEEGVDTTSSQVAPMHDAGPPSAEVVHPPDFAGTGPVPESPPAEALDQPIEAPDMVETAPEAEAQDPEDMADEPAAEAEAVPDVEPPFAAPDEEADEAAAADEAGVVEEENDLTVDFDQTNGGALGAGPPPMKRVHLSNQMDILAELEGLRKQATMDSSERWGRAPKEDVDIESLLAGSEPTRELRQKVEEPLNSDIFKKMRGLLVAVRVQNARGETIHTLEPVSLAVEKADKLEKLSIRFTLDLENQQ
jgi:signal recognition particle receptor subunit beta